MAGYYLLEMSEKSMSRLTKALELLTKMTSFNKTHNRLNFKVLFILKKMSVTNQNHISS